MFTRREAAKLAERNKSVDLTRKKQLPKRIGLITSETRIRSRFDSHTQSSLLKRKEPKMSTLTTSTIKHTKNTNGKKAEVHVLFNRLNGICKKRNSIAKQSKSMQTLKMLFKRERDRRISIDSSRNDNVTEMICPMKQRMEYPLTLLRDDLIVDVSRDLKMLATSPIANPIPHDKSTSILYQSKEHTKNMCVNSQDTIKLNESSSTFVPGSSESSSEYSDNHSILDLIKIQALNDDEVTMKKVDSTCQVLKREFSSGEPTEKSKTRVEIETQVYRRSRLANANLTNSKRKSTRKTWMIKKVDEHIDGDHAHQTNLRANATNSTVKRKIGNSDKSTKPVNDQAMARTKAIPPQRNLVSGNQRAWKPPGINRTSVEITTSSTQSTSQKSSRTAARFTASTNKNKQASNECVDSIGNKSTMQLMHGNQSKILMKENRDPSVDPHISKICNFAETKRPSLQSEAPLPKRRRSVAKYDKMSKTPNKRNDMKPMRSKSRSRSRSKSRSRYWQMRLGTPTSSKNQNNADQCRTESILTFNRRSRPSKVMHALKEIINKVKEDDDTKEESTVNISTSSTYYLPDSDSSERQISNRNIFAKIIPNDELRFTNNDSNEISQSTDFEQSYQASEKSISTQTESIFPLFSMLKFEKTPHKVSKKIIKPTKTVATQVSLNFKDIKKNVFEKGCNTTARSIISKDAEVSCYLIGTANVGTNVDLIMTENKLTSTENVKSEKSFDESKNLLCNEDETNKKLLYLNIKTNLENHAKVPVETDDVRETKKMIHKEDTDDIDGHQKFKRYTEKYAKHATHHDTRLIHVCSSSEFLENENAIKYENTKTTESEVRGIPNDVIAAFELAAMRAYNLHKAIMIYQENLMSTASKTQDEQIEIESTENREALCSTIDEDSIKMCARFANEGEDKTKSECETKCYFVMINNDYDGLSTCSSSDQMCECCMNAGPETCRVDHSEIENSKKSNVVLSQSEKAITRPILNESSNVTNVNSLMLVHHHMQGQRAFEMVQLNNDDVDGGNLKREESDNISSALPMTKKISFISRDSLFPLICCLLCTVVFWCLQFSFRCNPTV